jgi:hypothetical protein
MRHAGVPLRPAAHLRDRHLHWIADLRLWHRRGLLVQWRSLDLHWLGPSPLPIKSAQFRRGLPVPIGARPRRALLSMRLRRSGLRLHGWRVGLLLTRTLAHGLRARTGRSRRDRIPARTSLTTHSQAADCDTRIRRPRRHRYTNTDPSRSGSRRPRRPHRRAGRSPCTRPDAVAAPAHTRSADRCRRC